MMRFTLIILSIILFNFSNAQALISGIVLDAKTQEPIPFVSVLLNKTFKGASTNNRGEFTLEIPDYSSENTFTFQRVGYSTLTIGLIDLMRSDKVMLNIVEQQIGEVVITPVDALSLVERAVAKIPENYYSPPVGQDVFYRQTFYTNDELKGIEESRYHLINTFNRPKLARSVTVKKARGFINMDEYKSLGKIVAKNIKDDSIYVEESAENFFVFNPNLDDLLENSKGIFGENSSKNYVYDYVGMVIKNGYVMHHVAFDQKEGVKKTLFRGNMYIDTASLAIVELEAQLSPNGIDFQKLIPLKFRILAKLGGYKIVIYGLSFKANYKEYDGFWVVDKGGFTLNGSIQKRKQPKVKGAVNVDYIVLNNFPKTEFYNRKSEYDVIPSSLEPFKNVYFWGDTKISYLSQKAELRLNDLLKDL